MAFYTADELFILNCSWTSPHLFLGCSSISAIGIPNLIYTAHAIRDQIDGDYSDIMPIPNGTFKYAGILGEKVIEDPGIKIQFAEKGESGINNFGLPTYGPTNQTLNGIITFTGDVELEAYFRPTGYYDATNKIYEYGGDVEPVPNNALLIHCNKYFKYFRLHYYDKVIWEPIPFISGDGEPIQIEVTGYSLPGVKPDDVTCLRDTGRQNQKEWFVDIAGNHLSRAEVMASFRYLSQIEL